MACPLHISTASISVAFSRVACAAYQILCEPEAQAAQHAPQFVVRISDAMPVSVNTHMQRQSSGYADLMNVSGLSK
jgi:hypothetical protein